MDIREWLQNTADREPPDQEDHQGHHHHHYCDRAPSVHPQRQVERNAPRRLSRKRRRASSEHASIRSDAKKRRGCVAAALSSTSDQLLGAKPVDATPGSGQSTCSYVRDILEGRRVLSPTRKYERRPRRKTRPDLYEPKPNKRKKDRQIQKDKLLKSKSKRQRTRGSADGVRTSELAHSFHLKNVPKGGRLTLKPDVGAGIFKHGRSSARLAAGGPGLPDLVFNEMRFLQRPNEHQDELPAEHSAKDAPKKSKKQLQEEQVSSYFARKPRQENRTDKKLAEHQPVDHASAQSSLERTRRMHAQAVQSADGREQQAQQLVEPAVRPCLGEGSEGRSQERNEGHAADDSCYTWSDSDPIHPSPASRGTASQRSNPPAARKVRSQDDSPGQVQRQPRKDSVSVSDINSQAAMSDGRKETEHIAHVRDRKRAQAQPAAAHMTPLCHRIVANHSSGGRAKQRQEGYGRHSRLRRSSFHTSDILHIRNTVANDNCSSPSPTRRRESGAKSSRENRVPSTSTPVSKLLRGAFRAFECAHSNFTREPSIPDPLAVTVDGQYISEQPLLRQAIDIANNEIESRGADTVRRALAQFSERGYSRTIGSAHVLPHHHHRPQRLATPVNLEWMQGDWRRAVAHNAIPNNLSAARLPTFPDGFCCAPGREIEDSALRSASDQKANLFAARYDHLDCASSVFGSRQMDLAQDQAGCYGEGQVMEDFSTEQIFVDEQPVEGMFEYERHDGQQDEEAKRMMAFWRPNLLH